MVEGDASKSLLYHRLNSTDQNIMMPPLAKNLIDDQAASLIEAWINQLGQVADLTINYSLQGRGDHTADLRVDLYEPGNSVPAFQFTPTGSVSGVVDLMDIPPGTYVMAVKTSSHLQRVQTISLGIGTNTETVAELKAGDANDDNLITLADFTILSQSYNLQSGHVNFDPRADFNGDGFVVLGDFSLLSVNYNTMGEEVP